MTSFVNVFTGDVIQPTDVSYKSFSISANLDLVWPQDGDAAGDYAARIMQISASTTGLFVDMPPANQTSVGTDSLIRNTGSNTFTVRDYAGNTIIAIAAGEAKYIYVTNNATAAGTWGVIAFGVGSSSADASSLAGYGLKAITTTLNQSHPVTTTASSFTADATYRSKAVVWTGGVGTVSLTSAAALGDDWFMMIRNGGSGLLTIDPASTELINGSVSLSLQIGDSAFICCSGSAFYTVGLGQETTFAYSQLTLPVTSGTYTLTPAQAQNTIIKVTGTLSGNVSIVLPAAVQVYFVLVQTTGVYNVEFTTGVSGGTNATLTSSQQATLVCDSVNVLNATTTITGALAVSLINGSAAAPSLNFATETDMGMYRAGTGEIGWAISGTNIMTFAATGIRAPVGIVSGTF